MWRRITGSAAILTVVTDHYKINFVGNWILQHGHAILSFQFKIIYHLHIELLLYDPSTVVGLKVYPLPKSSTGKERVRIKVKKKNIFFVNTVLSFETKKIKNYK